MNLGNSKRAGPLYGQIRIRSEREGKVTRTALWAVLLALSTWSYEAMAQKANRYVGARGEFTSHNSDPIRWSGFSLSHRMVLEGGSYRLGSPGRLWGIAVGATIYSEVNLYREVPVDIYRFGGDNPLMTWMMKS